MKILKVLGVIVLTLVSLFFIIGLILPDSAHLERSIVIEAGRAKIFRQINTFNTLYAWSPWTKMDPNLKIEYFGPEFGIGAGYTWDSEDPNVGQGTQEIIESRSDQYVKTQMKFAGMEDGEFYAEFILEPFKSDTKLTWTYDGQTNNFFWRYFMASTDFMLGPMYEQGLRDLKYVIEGLPDVDVDPEMIVLDSTIVLE